MQIEGKEFTINEMPVKIANNWPFYKEYDGVFGLAHNLSSSLMTHLKSRYIPQVVSISFYSKALVLGGFNFKELDADSMAWGKSINSNWVVLLEKVAFYTSNDYSFNSQYLDFSGSTISLPREIYQSYIKEYLYKIGCDNSANLHVYCYRIKSSDYSRRPNLNLMLEGISITLGFDLFTSHLTSRSETRNNHTKTYYDFEVNINVTDDNTIRVPYWEIYNNYAVVFDYERGMVGFGKYKFNWAILLYILIGIGATVLICFVIFARAKPHIN